MAVIVPITITGENIDDTFGIDVRTILDIDLTVDGPMLVFAVSGTLEGTVNEIAIDVPDWSFTFQYEDTFTK